MTLNERQRYLLTALASVDGWKALLWVPGLRGTDAPMLTTLRRHGFVAFRKTRPTAHGIPGQWLITAQGREAISVPQTANGRR